MKFDRRHDTIAHERQRKLAQLLFLANLGIGASAGLLMAYWDWSFEPTGFEVGLLIGLFALSWLCLLTAAGAVGWLVGLFAGIPGVPPSGEPAVDEEFLAKHGMRFYYAGVIFNLVAFALVTEVTGGLDESPFTALLVAFVLTSQQLSRFRPQAAIMLGIGLAVTGLMLLLEPLASEPAAAAPHQLEVAAVLLALIGGGALNCMEKPPNHYVTAPEAPSRVLVYRDAQGNWRFSFYQRFHRQDPILLTGAAADGNAFPEELERQVIRYASEMATVAGWEESVPGWPKEFTTCFSIRLGTGAHR